MLNKIVFVNPPYSVQFNRDFEISPPIHLAYLGEEVKRAGWQPIYFDIPLMQKEFIDWARELDNLLSDIEIKIIGITNHTVRTSTTACKIADLIKEKRKDVLVVFGGVNSTFMWKELLQQNKNIDYIFRGYAQCNLVKFLTEYPNINTSLIPGLAWNENDISKSNTISSSPIEFLVPELNDINISQYLKYSKTYSLITHTGCLFSCNFCTAIMPGPYQNRELFRKVDDIILEIINAQKVGFSNIFMSANIFTSDSDWIIEFCKKMISEKLNNVMTWVCMTRVEYINNELLCLMKQAGCKNIAYGVEVADSSQWKSLNKGKYSARKIIDAFTLTRSNDIETTAYLMVGTPEQNKDSVEATINLLKLIDPDYRVVSFFQPFPGTSYWNSPESYGLYDIAPLEDWNFHENPICATRYFNKEELTKIAFRIYLERGLSRKLSIEFDSLRIANLSHQVYRNIPVFVSYAFNEMDSGISIYELLKNVKEKYSQREVLITLYWLSSALRYKDIVIKTNYNKGGCNGRDQ